MDTRTPPPARRTAAPGWAGVGLLVLLAACGGGGGRGSIPDDPVPPPLPVDGLAGRVQYPDVHLGRIIEQEPNDSQAQAFRLPPVSPRTVLEVTGQVGTTAARYGRIDPVDALRYHVLGAQDVTLALTFTPTDPISSAPNELEVAVFDTATGAPLKATTGGAQPRTATFPVADGQVVDVVVAAAFGHAAWVLTLTGADTLGAPKPQAFATAPEPTPVEAAVAYAEEEPECADDHVLVRFRSDAEAEEVARRRGLVLGRRTAAGSYLVSLPPETTSPSPRKALSLSAVLEGEPAVTSAEPDWIVRPLGTATDPEYGRQWNLQAIGVPSAWDITLGSPSLVIGVVDTGVVAHPDLIGQVVAGYDFISSPSVSADGGGRDPDPTDMGDRIDSSGLSSWHGTHVAAIMVARRNDGYGISGVAPGCKVMPLRALGVGGGLVSDTADAILYAAALYTTEDGHSLASPLKIVNLSLGLNVDSIELSSACLRAANRGVLLVAATGNSGGNVLYPAAYPYVVAVGAAEGSLDGTYYSNHGPEVDLSAPGGNLAKDLAADGWPDGILSAVVDQTVNPAVMSHNYLIGTSQAAPHVCGVAALVLSVDPSLSSSGLRTILEGTALDRGPTGKDIATGWGLVQAHAAVKLALEGLGTPRTDPPYLLLPITSLHFQGLETTKIVPVYNGGGGVLTITGAQPVTDDAIPWLSGSPVPAGPGAQSNASGIEVTITRTVLPAAPGRYTGSIRIYNDGGALGSLRVVLLVSTYNHAGLVYEVIAQNQSTTQAYGASASPANDYRFWFRGLNAGSYVVNAGEDLDGDGFICEPSDACGWFGGSSSQNAVPVGVASGTPTTGIEVILK